MWIVELVTLVLQVVTLVYMAVLLSTFRSMAKEDR